nr:N-acetylmuramoyl-L-alanine amidase [Bacteroides stercorirosoris]
MGLSAQRYHPGSYCGPHGIGCDQLFNRYRMYVAMIQETFPMTIGGEEVLNERELLAGVESGLMMDSTDSVRYIILHCSATRCNCDYTVEQLMRDHRARGFRTIGYHFYVRRDGTVSQHRRLLEVGAHCRPFNRCSIGVCYEGGLDTEGHPADTLTGEQFEQLEQLLSRLLKLFPKAQLRGHRDMPGSVPKACPSLDCQSVFRAIL